MEAVYSENLKHGRFETWTTKPEILMIHAHQVHGVEIVDEKSLPCQADGLFCSWNDFSSAMAIKTADCMPIVIEGELGVVFLHAGWRGLADGILRNEKISEIKPQTFYVGPCIRECCFEVSEDFKENFRGSPFFIQRANKLYFNMQEEAKRQILEMYPAIETKISNSCTCCNENFHSYRRNKTANRNWNLYLKG